MCDTIVAPAVLGRGDLSLLRAGDEEAEALQLSPDGTIIKEFKLPRLAAAAGSPSNPDCRFPRPPSETTHFSV